ncbi:hypothetical protein SARC_09076 [Sphaeroforma arctica JP610]|uniref:Uncharacterized protein n=1 Tax=Sphaeroforma arctica JP610 TaxID=667725 RepID=A0A0L0FNX3_9EUKA|nr:hypothetical protein SARC_09076 [Sphaeroforma arctica JP610]KNC78502.1 hypothetical protein SARC_09076 [Sphaeroforma arctica JP610]|eukprot:XP_014152404.1 hypothetical protein SARC_09076 [Sphaeroforma arctica JP610]
MKFEFIPTGEISFVICMDVPVEASDLQCCEGLYCLDHILKEVQIRKRCPQCRVSICPNDIAPAYSARRRINNLRARCVACGEEDTWNVLTRTHQTCAPNIMTLKPETRRVLYPYNGIEPGSEVHVCGLSEKWAMCLKQPDKTMYTIPRQFVSDPKVSSVPDQPDSTDACEF